MDTRNALQKWRDHGSLMELNGLRVFVSEYAPTDNPAPDNVPAILFLHGFPTASFDYARLLPHLLAKARLVFFDFLGFGFSDKPRPHRYSLFEQAALAEALCVRLGLSKVTLVAHDMGSSVALVLLARKRLEVSRLILLNGSLLLKYYQPLITQRLLLHPFTGPLLSALRVLRRPIFARQFSRLFPIPPPDDEVDAFWSLIACNDGVRIQHLLIQYLDERKQHEHEWLDALAAHRAPLLVLWGQRDPVSLPRIAEALIERRPDGRYVPLHALGHYPQWEDSETIAREILAFLQA